MTETFNLSSGVVAEADIHRANFRFDRDNPGWKHAAPCKPGWHEQAMLRRGLLTDRKINAYQARGWYSQEFKEARLELMTKKASKKAAFLARQGNFDLRDGRLIYNPA